MIRFDKKQFLEAEPHQMPLKVAMPTVQMSAGPKRAIDPIDKLSTERSFSDSRSSHRSEIRRKYDEVELGIGVESTEDPQGDGQMGEDETVDNDPDPERYGLNESTGHIERLSATKRLRVAPGAPSPFLP